MASLTRSGGTSGNGGTLSLKMSNGPVSLTASGTQTWTSGTSTGFFLGKHYSGGPTLLKGDVAELIVYNRVLTSGELAQMEDYLQTKYALRDSDTDGMADWWEEQNGLAVGTNDATSMPMATASTTSRSSSKTATRRTTTTAAAPEPPSPRP